MDHSLHLRLLIPLNLHSSWESTLHQTPTVKFSPMFPTVYQLVSTVFAPWSPTRITLLFKCPSLNVVLKTIVIIFLSVKAVMQEEAPPINKLTLSVRQIQPALRPTQPRLQQVPLQQVPLQLPPLRKLKAERRRLQQQPKLVKRGDFIEEGLSLFFFF